MENAICNLELQVLTKIYSAKKVTKKALAGVYSLSVRLTALGQWRRQKHHDEYHHRESGRYQRKGTVER